MSTADPFDTAELRAATLQAWRRSPTRLREDTATEADLVRGGYRDRVLTELAQNAADAAVRAGVRGELTVRLVGDELRVANTGAPLDRTGVQSLAALRASSKTGGVGRFGVGFTAVLAVTDEPRVLSTSGSVGFSAARTRAELGQADVPVLRLVWPVPEQPGAEMSTEVVLPLRAGIDGAALLEQFTAEAADLLLALPGLHSIAVGEAWVQRVEHPLASGLVEVRLGEQRWWSTEGSTRWLARVNCDGQVQPLGEDVLRAPTRTDEELSLPALLVADVPLQPDRRRLLPGTSLRPISNTYPELVAALPAEQRTRLVPLPGFPRSAVDAELREGVLAALRDASWLPAAEGHDLAPRAARVLDVANPELVALLADVIPGLLAAELSEGGHSAALVALGVPRLGWSAVADALSGVQRDPEWWRRLYGALDPLVVDRRAAEELAALPVPLVDGRTVLGPRSTVLAEVALTVPGVRVVHPEAAHPLLGRLGAVTAGASELLQDELLRDAVRQADPDDVLAAAELATAVLALVEAAGVRPGEHAWLGELLLPDADGELRPADELLLPDAPLHAVLSEDAPLSTVAARVVAEHGP
ncbi:MAG: ATP-binding protein, partial [Mycobacteriaceae bacterium]